MGTLSSALAPLVLETSDHPRVYADANIPAGLVTFMRTRLHWDVLFVVEHDELRRARDGDHYRLAREWGRTLLTLDRDYLDDRRFRPEDSGGVVVLAAPTDSGYEGLLTRLDPVLRTESELPLEGRKLHVHVDWPGIEA